MLRALVIADCFFKMAYAFLRSFEKPAGASHVRVNLAKQVRRWMIADQFQSLLEIFKSVFVMTFERVGHSDAEIGVGQPAPIARFTVMFESFLRVVARDCKFADASIDARERRVDCSQIRVRATTFCLFAQRGFEERYRFRM